MKGIQLIQDAAGQITGIRLEIQDDPEMAQEVYHLIRVLNRAKETEESLGQAIETPDPRTTHSKPMSLTAFNKLIRTAKSSGEITQEEFFQLHPTWQRDEKLSLPN